MLPAVPPALQTPSSASLFLHNAQLTYCPTSPSLIEISYTDHCHPTTVTADQKTSRIEQSAPERSHRSLPSISTLSR